MKKKLAVLLCLTMVLTFALASCGGSGDVSDSEYVGTWKASFMSLGEETGDFENNYTLTLNGDGTGTFLYIDEDGTEEASDITWSLTNDGFQTKGDTKLKFKDDGEGIKANVIGVDLHFERADGDSEEVVDLIDGAAYGYAGDDPVEAACYQYMAETVSKDYEAADVSIPVVNVVHEDMTGEDEVLVYGDFWIYNYKTDGDTFKCVSGGNYPGCMHVSKTDYTVTAFDVVADGGAWEESAKEIFGENYEDFAAAHSNSDANDELRKITVSDYVNLNGLDIKYYQDEGWDPVELYHAPGAE